MADKRKQISVKEFSRIKPIKMKANKQMQDRLTQLKSMENDLDALIEQKLRAHSFRTVYQDYQEHDEAEELKDLYRDLQVFIISFKSTFEIED